MNSIGKNLNDYMIEYMICHKDVNNQNKAFEVEQVELEAMDIDRENFLSKQAICEAKIMDSQPGDLSIKGPEHGSQPEERQFERYMPKFKASHKINNVQASYDRTGCSWTPQEDKIVLEKIKEIGKQWQKIAEYLPGRSANGIKTHFHTRLKGKEANFQVGEGKLWTPQEDAILLEKIRVFGHQWNKFVEYLPGRTSNAIGARFFDKFGQENIFNL